MRQFPGLLGGQFAEFNAEVAERVVTGDDMRLATDRYEDPRDIPRMVLSGPPVQVSVEGFVAASKGRPIVVPAERLDAAEIR